MPAARFGSSLANMGNAFGGPDDGLAVSTRAPSVVLHQWLTATNEWSSVQVVPDNCPGGSTPDFSLALASVDVDDNGTADLIVGDAGCSQGNGLGWVGVYRAGLYATPFFSVSGPSGKSEFGRAVAGIGDVDRDGRDDFAVGAPAQVLAATRPGAVHVIRGTSSLPSVFGVLLGDSDKARFGESIAGGRDVNFDGFADLVVGTPGVGAGAGAFVVYRGTATAMRPLMGEGGGAGFAAGTAVAMGNVNLDSNGDVAVGAPGGEKTVAGGTPTLDEGLVIVYRGTW